MSSPFAAACSDIVVGSHQSSVVECWSTSHVMLSFDFPQARCIEARVDCQRKTETQTLTSSSSLSDQSITRFSAEDRQA